MLTKGLNSNKIKKFIQVANKNILADVVVKNGQIIDVFNLRIIKGDLAIVDGMIVGIGEYEGKQIIDAKNKYVCPSFIDSHVHIESSMITPYEFSKIVLPHGVTTVITDPHEIANVSGVDGIKFMLDNSEGIDLDVMVMLPSSVPATPFENSGANLIAEDLEPFFQHERVLGLAEVMDYPSLRNGSDSILNKINSTLKHRNHIDGHLAGLDNDAINIYRTAGIKTDHECNSVTEALERLSRGLYLLIREGSVAKDLNNLIKVVSTKNARRCLFCTDDKHLDDLINEGSIDHNVRLAIEANIDPLLAIQIASLNAAECYGLQTKGAVAPGYEADFLLLNDLNSITISEVYKAGELVAKNGSYVGSASLKEQVEPSLLNTINTHEITENQLQLTVKNPQQARIIEIIPNSLITKKCIGEVDVHNGQFAPSITDDLLKLVVVERHHKTGNVGLGVVRGFGLTCGAIATTIAHDSHNIVATGTNDNDIIFAIQAMKEMNGGLVVVKDGQILASLALPIGGLMSQKDFATVNVELKMVKKSLDKLGFHGHFNPFLTLSFLTLPVIPELKLTDLGLFDMDSFKHIDV